MFLYETSVIRPHVISEGDEQANPSVVYISKAFVIGGLVVLGGLRVMIPRMI